MLVLSRKIGETLCIDNKIEITILWARGGQIKLGIKAPKNILVNRLEIQRRINEGDRHIKNDYDDSSACNDSTASIEDKEA